MSQITTPIVQPAIVVSEAAILGGASNTYTALQVILYEFELLAPTTFSGVKFRTGSTATGSADAGIYDANGNLKANIGGLVNVASASVSQAFQGGNITLAPGRYYIAFVSQNATDTYIGINATVAGALFASRFRVAANAATVPVSVVVLPATTGVISAPATSKMPAVELTVVGGI